jgi:hypothetical protein
VKNSIPLLVSLLLLAGCHKPVRDVFVCEREARMADVPTVLDARPIKKEITDSVYVYASALGQQELAAWYNREMERLGWRLMAYNGDPKRKNGSPTLRIFEKPSTVCAINFRQAGKRTIVRIDYMLRQTQLD